MRIWLALGLVACTPATGVEGPASRAEHAGAPRLTGEPLLSNVRQLTFAGRRSGEGYYSADGSRMVFQSERLDDNPFYQIYSMDLTDGEVRRVSAGVGKTTCAWFDPNGPGTLYASTHHDPSSAEQQRAELERRARGESRRYALDFDPAFDLYLDAIRLDDAQGYDAEGSFSPDGRFIAFASNRHAYAAVTPDPALGRDPSRFLDIYLRDVSSGQTRRLTDAPGYDGGPFFSADGALITWRRFTEDGARAEIWVMNADGSEQRAVTRLGVMSWAPYFHPSGDYIIFATNQQGFENFELYTVDTAGQREPVRVTHTAGFDGLPVFHPDGRQLSWTTTRGGGDGAQIFVADWGDDAAREALGLRPPPQPAAQSARRADDPTGFRNTIEYLASEELAGRLTGTAGERLATEYTARMFERFGLVPAGDDGTWFQSFDFTAGVELGPNNRLGAHPVEVDWRPLAFSATGTFEAAEIVFAGYGIVAPAQGDQPEYDAYVHLNVEDRWVLVLRYLPEDIAPERRQHLGRYALLRHKELVARERGARGLIVVTGPRAEVKSQLVPLATDATLSPSTLAVVSVTDRVADGWLQQAGKALEGEQMLLDNGEVRPGFSLGVRIGAEIDLITRKGTGRNVLGVVPGSQRELPAVVIGAHIDHLGPGIGGNSLASDEERGRPHLGADDNASGVAAVLDLARTMGALPGNLRRDVVFAAWSGEEIGVLGSNHYASTLAGDADPPDIAGRVAAYLNFDMIGRFRDALVIQGVGSSDRWRSVLERANAPVGLPLVLQTESYLPTDATPFYVHHVPVLNAFTGAHADYHTPRDTPERINYAALPRITDLMHRVAVLVAADPKAPAYQRMKKPKGPGRGFRAYLGTIPDYAGQEVDGVRLSGVAAGGPAETAGVRGGDVVVELGGRKIENIYDYTYALQALKVGEATKLIVLRKGERVELEVVPGSRD